MDGRVWLQPDGKHILCSGYFRLRLFRVNFEDGTRIDDFTCCPRHRNRW